LITSPEHIIAVSPIGELDESLLEQILRDVHRMFGFRTEIISLLNDADFALDPVRNQYYSTVILKSLAELAPVHAIKVIAIAKVDLFIPILTYVYGEAQLDGRACIISTSRLNEGLSPVSIHETFHSRVVKEAIHELGHTFNLRHCPDHSCAMHYCRAIGDVDRKSDQFCRYCKVLLEDSIKRLKKV